MRLALVTCFNADWHFGKIPAPYVPLNLLGLGATVRRDGHVPIVIDQTLALLQGQATDGPQFHREMAELIVGQHPDVIGLTTMCNSYPQTLALARQCRDIDPTVKILLGGPQATVVDVDTLQSFPWVDAIVRNEADLTLGQVLDRWADGDTLEDVPGVTWRRPGDAVVRNLDAPKLPNMDVLPYPAYDLYPFGEVDVTLAPVEAGRGCPYGCTFCSTNVYFNRRYRIKSVERLIEEMRFLQERYGFDHFDLVHDMLTVDRRWVQQFCRALLEADQQFKWGCSARVDRVDDTLLSEMAEAGCIGIFFGVETGSQRMQPIVKKRLQIEQVLPIMRSCIAHKIAPTGSLITGFPDETVDDALDSFNLALDILQLAPETRAQMHLLAPLVGSPLYELHKNDLRFDGHSSDISLFLLDDEEIETVRRHPEIFPNFYFIPTPQLDRETAKAISAATYTCPALFIALRHAGADLRQVLAGWTAWQRRHVPRAQIRQDYYMYRFGLDLCRYLKAEVLGPLTAAAPYLPDLVTYIEVRYALQRGLRREATVFRQFDHDVQRLTTSLREGGQVDAGGAPFDLLFVNLTFSLQRGHVFLEVRVPQDQDPVVRPGDALEVRDPVRQLLTRPELIIRNNTQRRVFATKHHLTQRHLEALGLPRTPAGSGAR